MDDEKIKIRKKETGNSDGNKWNAKTRRQEKVYLKAKLCEEEEVKKKVEKDTKSSCIRNDKKRNFLL